jgi:hypothetical protein
MFCVVAYSKGHIMTLLSILKDPNRMTCTVTEAAQILGISRTTAYFAYTKTGSIVDGVPVLVVSTGSNRERRVVSTAHLRAVLGMTDPE